MRPRKLLLAALGFTAISCGDDAVDDAADEIGSETLGDSDSTGDSSSSSDSSSSDSSSSDATDSSSTDSDSTDATDSGSTDATDSGSTDSGSTDSGSTDATGSDSTDTGEEPPICAPAAFTHAPPTIQVDGLTAVPIDILSLEASMSFDLLTQQAAAEVTVSFQVGELGGMPIFDLRQTIAEAELDGQPIAPAQILSHDFGKGLASGFRVLEAELEPCSIHTLWLSYPVNLPASPLSGGLQWLPADALYFDLWLSDLYPGRYLESWLPANMPYDRYPLSLALTLIDAGSAHTLISNAAVEEIGEHDWQLEFPETMTAMAPLIVVLPSEAITSVAGTHPANGQDIPYALYRNVSVATDLASLEATLLTALDDFTLSTGDFLHPAMIGYVDDNGRSMEYDGGFTTKAGDLTHEAFHSWWARGAHPATYADGWIDEAWDMYNTTLGQSFTIEPFDWNAAPVALYDSHPFARVTPIPSYTHGRRVFAGLAAIMGVDGLRMAMADLYVEVGLLDSLSTATLEQHLYCNGGQQPEIRQAFWRYIYGQAGPAPAPDMNYCG